MGTRSWPFYFLTRVAALTVAPPQPYRHRAIAEDNHLRLVGATGGRTHMFRRFCPANMRLRREIRTTSAEITESLHRPDRFMTFVMCPLG